MSPLLQRFQIHLFLRCLVKKSFNFFTPKDKKLERFREIWTFFFVFGATALSSTCLSFCFHFFNPFSSLVVWAFSVFLHIVVKFTLVLIWVFSFLIWGCDFLGCFISIDKFSSLYRKKNPFLICFLPILFGFEKRVCLGFRYWFDKRGVCLFQVCLGFVY